MCLARPAICHIRDIARCPLAISQGIARAVMYGQERFEKAIRALKTTPRKSEE